ncbi:pyridoxal phosphate-dependent aminotransferase [Exiguobacterium sp. A1_3_1]|uniref:Aminotransferase n=2 Tax=Exiguobacterium TaxID=33986 RepID=A0A0V8GKH5_9BACL|nr:MULTISPECIES: pyridoxal phosphate-dependent aminotransferase [Exiguobacterium]KSU50736.1 aspartate aminotransferase [Exiguobacterium enclense]KTR26584.1 aspartate aminotransferase [Exiguobacterium indicum]MCQ4089990.1 pyridoxal phosphate-dependent aminotransferase [Exiguobacterium sp. LL15]NTY09826.1 pyridoxal phosphate-dependent aminotransferase [Exiguobacterium sp. JMULE1]SDC05403.1 L-aspartate aminotransferase apoenzyme [Exiguobacterium enclense]
MLSKRVRQLTPSTTLAITAKAKALREEGQDIIGLGAGEPDFNTPEFIIQAAFEAAEAGDTKYTPSGGTVALKDAIIEKTRRDLWMPYERSEVMVASGAKHALSTLFQAILDPGDEVIVPAPYWVSYPEQIKLSDGIPVILETDESSRFKVTRELLEQHITPKTKALVLNSPSNPTGMVYSKEELEMVADVAIKHDLLVISDEIYEKLLYNGATHISIASLPEMRERTVIINGVSKSHAMTGWRIGYAIGPKEIISAMTNLASHSTSNPTSIAQAASVAAYAEGDAPVEAMRVIFEERLEKIYARLIEIEGLTCLKPEGAFYLFPHAKQAAEMCGFDNVDDWCTAVLSEAKVALIPGSGFGAPDYVRLSYATDPARVLEALDRIEGFITAHTAV